MNKKQELGKKGEELAAQKLMSLGYTILETNWQSGHLEIDLIAENENTIVFCEVKTRSSNKLGNPESFVTLQKQRNLIRAASSYINRYKKSKPARFDIVSILQKKEDFIIDIIPNAFSPKW